jgi:hypothetical protein
LAKIPKEASPVEKNILILHPLLDALQIMLYLERLRAQDARAAVMRSLRKKNPKRPISDPTEE